MTIFKNIVEKNPRFFKFESKKKDFFSNILRSLFLPLAFLTVASIFHAIMYMIRENVTNNNAIEAMYVMSNLLLSLFPVFITLGVAASFSKKYVLASILSITTWVVFIGIQSALIKDGKVLFYSDINPFINYFAGSKYLKNIAPNVIVGVLFGFLISFSLNKLQDHKTFKYVNFNRFMLFLFPIVILIITILHIIVSGAIALGLTNWIKQDVTAANTFLFGMVERLLLPFGFQGAIQTNLNTSAVVLNGAIAFQDSANNIFNVTSIGGQAIKDWSQLTNNLNLNNETFYNLLVSKMVGKEIVLDNGSSFVFNIHNAATNSTWWQGSQPYLLTVKHHTFGAYSSSNLLSSLFVIPVIGILMIFLAPKKERIFAFQIVIASIVSSFFVGTQNVILYLLFFSTPVFFIFFVGIIIPLMQLIMFKIGIQVETVNSGIAEIIHHGIIADVNGAQTGIGILIAFSIIFAALIGVSFWYWVKFVDAVTPGRGYCDAETMSAEQTHFPEYILFYKGKGFSNKIVTKEFAIKDNISASNSDILVDELAQKSNISQTDTFSVDNVKDKKSLSETQEINVTDTITANTIEVKTFSNELKTYSEETVTVLSPARATVETRKKNHLKLVLLENDTNIYSPMNAKVEYISETNDEIILSYKFAKVILQLPPEIDINKYLNLKVKKGSTVQTGDILYSINEEMVAKEPFALYLWISVVDSDLYDIQIKSLLTKTSVSKTTPLFEIKN